MKRTRLKAKPHPENPYSTFGPRKTRLNPVSKTKRAKKSQTDAKRRQYVKHSQICQCCNRRPAVDPHEMARGAHRSEAVKHRECWLALCRRCHEAMDDYREWPLTRQLAVKLVSDPNYFDLKVFNAVRGRDENAITLADVVQHLEVRS